MSTSAPSLWKRFVLFSSFYGLTALPHHPKTRPHWNEVIPGLVLGGIPIETRFMGRGDHGNKIIDQCAQSNRPLSLVVSAMEDWELEGKGLLFLRPVSTQFWQSKGIRHQHVKMADFSGDADLKDIKAATDAIQAARTTGKTAYIHCKAGRGRSFLITMCYLMQYQGMSVNQALQTIYQARPQVSPSQRQFDTIEAFRRTYCPERAALNKKSDGFSPFNKSIYAYLTQPLTLGIIVGAFAWATAGVSIPLAALLGYAIKQGIEYVKAHRLDQEQNEYQHLKTQIAEQGNANIPDPAIASFNVGVDAANSWLGWSKSMVNLPAYRHQREYLAGIKAGKEEDVQLQQRMNKAKIS